MSFHVEYPANDKGRDFVVGDLHGMLNAFEQALISVDFDKESDRCFSVGDLIDRGPDSMGCLRLIYEPWFIPVQGNHEQMMLVGLTDGGNRDNFLLWMLNGGAWIYKSMGDPRLLASVAEDLAKLPFAITVTRKDGEKVGICHAEPPLQNWSQVADVEQDERACGLMIWGRTHIQAKDAPLTEGVLFTVHGHTIVEEPTMVGNALFIDTGGFLTRKITLVDINAVSAAKQEAA